MGKFYNVTVAVPLGITYVHGLKIIDGIQIVEGDTILVRSSRHIDFSSPSHHTGIIYAAREGADWVNLHLLDSKTETYVVQVSHGNKYKHAVFIQKNGVIEQADETCSPNKRRGDTNATYNVI